MSLSALALALGDDVLQQRRLARRFGAEDLSDSAARHAAYAERQIQRDRTGRNDLDLQLGGAIAQPHNRPFAKCLVDLADRHF